MTRDELFQIIAGPAKNSYALVLMDSFLSQRGKGDKAEAKGVLDLFMLFYALRRSRKLDVEQEPPWPIQAIHYSSRKDAWNFLAGAPYKELEALGILKLEKEGEKTVFALAENLRRSLKQDDFPAWKEAIGYRLRDYYASIPRRLEGEVPEKGPPHAFAILFRALGDAEGVMRSACMSALDLEDDEKAQKILLNAKERLRQIRRWRASLEAVCDEMGSFAELGPFLDRAEAEEAAVLPLPPPKSGKEAPEAAPPEKEEAREAPEAALPEKEEAREAPEAAPPEKEKAQAAPRALRIARRPSKKSAEPAQEVKAFPKSPLAQQGRRPGRPPAKQPYIPPMQEHSPFMPNLGGGRKPSWIDPAEKARQAQFLYRNSPANPPEKPKSQGSEPSRKTEEAKRLPEERFASLPAPKQQKDSVETPPLPQKAPEQRAEPQEIPAKRPPFQSGLPERGAQARKAERHKPSAPHKKAQEARPSEEALGAGAQPPEREQRRTERETAPPAPNPAPRAKKGGASEEMRAMLRRLSSSGFAFSVGQLYSLFDATFSRARFGLSHPAAKAFSMADSLHAQSLNGYYQEVFSFGQEKLLFASEWTKEAVRSFSEWVSEKRVSEGSASQQPDAKGEYLQEEGIPPDRLVSMTAFGQTFRVRSWGDVLILVCEILLAKKPFIVAAFDEEPRLNAGGPNFSYEKGEIDRSPRRLSNGLWVETARKKADIMRACADIVSLCGFSPDSFLIEAGGGA
jgi:hypothetical protein